MAPWSSGNGGGRDSMGTPVATVATAATSIGSGRLARVNDGDGVNTADIRDQPRISASAHVNTPRTSTHEHINTTSSTHPQQWIWIENVFF